MLSAASSWSKKSKKGLKGVLSRLGLGVISMLSAGLKKTKKELNRSITSSWSRGSHTWTGAEKSVAKQSVQYGTMPEYITHKEKSVILVSH